MRERLRHDDGELTLHAPLLSHFRELRKRLLTCFVTVAVLSAALFAIAADELMRVVTEPVKTIGINFVYVGLAEALTAQIKVTLIAASIMAVPVLLYELWRFVKPALYPDEQRKVLLFGGVALLLFVVGVIFGYGVVFLAAVAFFVALGQDFASPMLSISEYVNFLLGFVVPFGLAFELPVVLYALASFGLVNSKQLVACRRHVILAIAIIAALLTPPDVVSQVLMALPMLLLYEIGIRVVRYAERSENFPEKHNA